ncbi:MAG: UvrD-helicase domain-containing protein [Bdellovibrionales bacterium]|nr:UvrD-helicase domain-containing protein [Bdellovibrionales bacterium]
MMDFDWDAGKIVSKSSLEHVQPDHHFRVNPHPDFLNNLNDKQREAVQITEGPLIVLAGAGSGKTKMLTSRIAYLVEARGVAPYQILAVTFTNKAAQEMKERVARLLGENPTLVTPEIGTFHSVCVRILRREAQYLPFSKPFVIYDDSDQLTLLKAVVKRLGLDDKAFNPKSFQGAINRLKCDAVEPADLRPEPHDLFQKKLLQVFIEYEKEMIANNAVDFGEILCMTYRLFRDHPNVREKYQKRYRYLMVDEYQDTNRAQYLLLSMLAKKVHGGHENICVVGDEDQSIYKWRGADIRNILDFETDYAGAQVVKLEQNYRSTQTIIGAAAQVIRNNRERKEKTLWTENPVGEKIKRVQVPDERAEAELVISEIKRICAKDGRAYSDFAIIYRTHAQSRQFEDRFRREKIPYEIIGGLRFYDRKEIKDILAYFRAILNPQDSVSLKRIINVPARGIGKTTMDRIEEVYESLPIGERGYWNAIVQVAREPSLTSAATAKKIGAFVQLIERLVREQPKLSVSDLYHLILDETGYVRELKQEATDESMARVENLEEFDSLLSEFEQDFFEARPGLNEEQKETVKAQMLPEFLEASTLATDVTGPKTGSDTGDVKVPSVRMMSLHSSKGLEFPVVFIPGMEEGLFPSIRDWEDEDESELEEERRLCYVGMTRARERLYLTSAGVRLIWGETHYQEPARFFAEISDELIDFHDFSYGGGTTARGSSRSFTANSGSYGGPRNDAQNVPAYEAESQAVDEVMGARIDHPDYGTGKVLHVEGSGESKKVTIQFQNRMQKKFLLRFVKDFLHLQ